MEYTNTDIGENLVRYSTTSNEANKLTIIFIHGFPFDSTVWEEQLKSLSSEVRGIAYDIRGYGGSTSPHPHLNLDIFARDLLSLIDELSLDKVILCGISMGGYIALRAYELAKDKFTGLILCDTNSQTDSNEGKIKRFKSIQKLLDGNKAEFTEEFIKNVFSHQTQKQTPEVVSFLKSIILRTSDETICSTLLALASRTETSHVLTTIDVPVLIIRGSEDKLMSEEQTNLLVQEIKGSEMVLIENAGHLPNLEKPVEFNKALNSFLSKHFLS